MMAYYRFELDVIAGGASGADTLAGKAFISNGAEAMLFADPGFGPGFADSGGGYSTLHMTTEPGAQVGYEGADLDGTEQIWFVLIEINGASMEMVDAHFIGPYTVSEVGTEAPAS